MQNRPCLARIMPRTALYTDVQWNRFLEDAWILSLTQSISILFTMNPGMMNGEFRRQEPATMSSALIPRMSSLDSETSPETIGYYTL